MSVADKNSETCKLLAAKAAARGTAADHNILAAKITSWRRIEGVVVVFANRFRMVKNCTGLAFTSLEWTALLLA